MQVQPKFGQVWRHHSGRIYTILAITNSSKPSEKFPVMVHYVGSNGEEWSRDVAGFLGSFKCLYDGTTTCDEKGFVNVPALSDDLVYKIIKPKMEAEYIGQDITRLCLATLKDEFPDGVRLL